MLHTLFSREPKLSDDETMACFERLGLDKYQVQDSIFRTRPGSDGEYRVLSGLHRAGRMFAVCMAENIIVSKPGFCGSRRKGSYLGAAANRVE